MSYVPEQIEVKALLHDLVKHGDQTKIASALSVTPADISHRFNPANEERKPAIWEGLRELGAIAGVDMNAFRGIRAYMETLFDSWEKPASLASLPVLVIAADKEAGEVIRAWAAGKPAREQRAEAVEAIAALKQFVEGLDSQSGRIREAK